ncbi:S8 family serine peptidase [Halobacteriaceae archaeon GCM10025711]
MTRPGTDLARRTFLKLTGAAGASLGLGVAAGTPGRDPGPKEGEVLVGVSATADDVRAAVAEHVPDHARIEHVNETLRYVAVAFPDDAADAARERFMDRVTGEDHVKYAERNATHEALLTPDDPRFSDQYAPQMVNADAAWDTTLGDLGVTVAVVDTGVQYDHEDLADHFGSDKGHDFVDSDSDPYPDVPSDEYHGTHVSGIAAGVTDNGTGVAGVSDSTLLSGRALDEGGSGSTSDIADAIEWAADQGADVINLSLGGGGYTNTMKNAVSYAYDNGSLIVAAAGNDYGSPVSYPAAYSECVAISALDADGSIASYSNYGSEIELCAPGTDVLSSTTDARGSYEKLSGTSMATPVVAGVAALTQAQWSLSNADLRAHLEDTAVDMGLSSDKQGSGRADAENAVTTEPGSGGGGGGGGGGGSTTSSVDDSLSGYWDSDCWTYAWEYADPSQVVVELSGPADADFDLYVNESSTSCPTTSDYDYRSWTTDSQESITIDNPDTSTDLHVLVDSYSGSGGYTLTITEYE